MFIRPDGLATDHSANAALFYSANAALECLNIVRAGGCTLPIFIVSIEVVPSFKKATWRSLH